MSPPLRSSRPLKPGHCFRAATVTELVLRKSKLRSSRPLKPGHCFRAATVTELVLRKSNLPMPFPRKTAMPRAERMEPAS
jgi:hypothetical protein